MGFPPKSSSLMGFSIINQPVSGTPIYGNSQNLGVKLGSIFVATVSLLRQKPGSGTIPCRSYQRFTSEIDVHSWSKEGLDVELLFSLQRGIQLTFTSGIVAKLTTVGVGDRLLVFYHVLPIYTPAKRCSTIPEILPPFHAVGMKQDLLKQRCSERFNWSSPCWKDWIWDVRYFWLIML